MMILDPLNGVTSLNFYRRVAKQSVGRSFLYLAYLSVLFSITATAAMKLKVGPAVDETFQWLERSAPPLMFQGGKVTSTATAPVTVRHPSIKEIAFTIDTARTEPVTPAMMEENKVMAYLTSNAFYVVQRPGKVEVYDFSKAAPPKPVVIDSAFYRSANQVMNRVLYPAALVATFFLFLIVGGTLSLFYSVLALILNAALKGGLEYAALFNIAVYAQTLAIVLQMISFFTPVGLSMFSLPAMIATGVYIGLAIKRTTEPEAPAPAAPPQSPAP